jgi:hypothetical protein
VVPATTCLAAAALAEARRRHSVACGDVPTEHLLLRLALFEVQRQEMNLELSALSY